MSLPKRLQRGDVENFGAIVQIACQRFAHQPINAGEERGQRLARAGGRGDQRGVAGEDVRPALLLRLGGRAETSDKPLLDEGCAQANESGTGRDIGGVF